MQTNKNYDNLEQSYLFSTIARKVREYSKHIRRLISSVWESAT